MTEDDFWTALEFRICREFQGMEDGRMRNLWCDGIRGGLSRPDNEPAHVSGAAWIGDPMIEMPFKMALPDDAVEGSQILWEKLYPAEDLTAWLFVDLKKKQLAIDISKGQRLPSD